MHISTYGIYPSSIDLDSGDTLPNEEQIAVCQDWIRRHARPTKTIRKRHSSYGLKHYVESSTRRSGQAFDQVDSRGREWVGDYYYVTNGAFIEAARREGYRIVRTDAHSPNAFFNMVLTSY